MDQRVNVLPGLWKWSITLTLFQPPLAAIAGWQDLIHLCLRIGRQKPTTAQGDDRSIIHFLPPQTQARMCTRIWIFMEEILGVYSIHLLVLFCSRGNMCLSAEYVNRCHIHFGRKCKHLKLGRICQRVSLSKEYFSKYILLYYIIKKAIAFYFATILHKIVHCTNWTLLNHFK